MGCIPPKKHLRYEGDTFSTLGPEDHDRARLLQEARERAAAKEAAEEAACAKHFNKSFGLHVTTEEDRATFEGDGLIRGTFPVFKPGGAVATVDWLGGDGPAVGVCDDQVDAADTSTWQYRATWFLQRRTSPWARSNGMMLIHSNLSATGKAFDTHDLLKTKQPECGDSIHIAWDSMRNLLFSIDGHSWLNATPEGHRLRDNIGALYLCVICNGTVCIHYPLPEVPGRRTEATGQAEQRDTSEKREQSTADDQTDGTKVALSTEPESQDHVRELTKEQQDVGEVAADTDVGRQEEAAAEVQGYDEEEAAVEDQDEDEEAEEEQHLGEVPEPTPVPEPAAREVAEECEEPLPEAPEELVERLFAWSQGLRVLASQDRAAIAVTSADHASAPRGMYFNFDREAVPGLGEGSQLYLTVVSARTGLASGVVVWGQANGGSTGDAHGRLTLGASAGQWQEGDALFFGEDSVTFEGTGIIRGKDTVFTPGGGEVITVQWVDGDGPGIGCCDDFFDVGQNMWQNRATWVLQKHTAPWAAESGIMFINPKLSETGETDSHTHLLAYQPRVGDRIRMTWDADRNFNFSINHGPWMNATPGAHRLRSDIDELHPCIICNGTVRLYGSSEPPVSDSGAELLDEGLEVSKHFEFESSLEVTGDSTTFKGVGFVKGKEGVLQPGNGTIVTVEWVDGDGPGIGVCNDTLSVTSNSWEHRATWFLQKSTEPWFHDNGSVFINSKLSATGKEADSHSELAASQPKAGDHVHMTWDAERNLLFKVNDGTWMNATPEGHKLREDVVCLHMCIICNGTIRVQHSQAERELQRGTDEEQNREFDNSANSEVEELDNEGDEIQDVEELDEAEDECEEDDSQEFFTSAGVRVSTSDHCVSFEGIGFVKSAEAVLKPGNGVVTVIEWLEGDGPGIGVCDSGLDVESNSWQHRATWFLQQHTSPWAANSGMMIINSNLSGTGKAVDSHASLQTLQPCVGDRIYFTWKQDKTLAFSVNAGEWENATPEGHELNEDLIDLHVYIICNGTVRVSWKTTDEVDAEQSAERQARLQQLSTVEYQSSVGVSATTIMGRTTFEGNGIIKSAVPVFKPGDDSVVRVDWVAGDGPGIGVCDGRLSVADTATWQCRAAWMLQQSTDPWARSSGKMIFNAGLCASGKAIDGHTALQESPPALGGSVRVTWDEHRNLLFSVAEDVWMNATPEGYRLRDDLEELHLCIVCNGTVRVHQPSVATGSKQQAAGEEVAEGGEGDPSFELLD